MAVSKLQMHSISIFDQYSMLLTINSRILLEMYWMNCLQKLQKNSRRINWRRWPWSNSWSNFTKISKQSLNTFLQLSKGYHRNWSVSYTLEKNPITPIFNEGLENEIADYHPIASLSKLTLAFERILFRSISKHLQDKLSSHQFGFQKSRSCVIQLQSFFGKIFEWIDSKQ